MISPAFVDLYAVLGVARSASAAELRRAYRRLALTHHPDRAGPAGAPKFAQIAEAYRLLSSSAARAAYDAHAVAREIRRAGAAANGGDAGGWTVSGAGWTASWAAPIPDLLPRVTGPIAELVASGAAAVEPDGVVALRLTAAEAASGGTAVVTMRIELQCPTCGGAARPRGVWCARCEHAGRLHDDVAVRVRIPRGARTGLAISGACAHPGAQLPMIRIRLSG